MRPRDVIRTLPVSADGERDKFAEQHAQSKPQMHVNGPRICNSCSVAYIFVYIC